MKKFFLFAGLAAIATLLMVSCENPGGGSSKPADAKLWPAYSVNDQKWGYVDAAGKWQIPARFTEARNFSGIYALVRDGKLSFIGTDGNYVTAPAFDDCTGEFHNGYMRFSKNGFWGLMNSNLTTEIDPYRSDLGEMSDIGLISCRAAAGDLYSYININNKTEIEPQFQEAREFIDGIAVVKRTGATYGAINKNNKIVIEAKYAELISLGNGRLSYYDSEHRKYGLMDTQGNPIGSPRFKHIGQFTDNGMAVVLDENYKYGYIDRNANELNLANGKPVMATEFHEGIAFVKYVESGDFQAIGTNGQKIFDLKNGEAPYTNFWNGLCLLWSVNNGGNNAYRYVDTKGTTKFQWEGNGSNGQPSTPPISEPTYVPGPDDPSTVERYIKHPWDGVNWTWQAMNKHIISEEGQTYTFYFYQGTWGDYDGCNINTIDSDAGADWYSNSMAGKPFYVNVENIYKGQLVYFVYNPNEDYCYVTAQYPFSY